MNKLVKIRKFFGYFSLLLLTAFIVSLVVDFIHPLFWASMICGCFGIYGVAKMRLENE